VSLPPPRDLITINGPAKMLVDGEPEAARMRWMIGARDRMLKVASIGVFYEDSRIVVAIPLLETAEGQPVLDMEYAAGVVAEVARVAMNEMLKKIIAGEKRKAKKARAKP
jgi:hypothetical protein